MLPPLIQSHPFLPLEDRVKGEEERIVRATTFVPGGGGELKVPRQCSLVLLVKEIWRGMTVLGNCYAAAFLTY
jgi:hypothetical protein